MPDPYSIQTAIAQLDRQVISSVWSEDLGRFSTSEQTYSLERDEYNDLWKETDRPLRLADRSLNMIDQYDAVLYPIKSNLREVPDLEKVYFVNFIQALDDQKRYVLREVRQTNLSARDDVLLAVQTTCQLLEQDHTALKASTDDMQSKLDLLLTENSELRSALQEMCSYVDKLSVRRQIIVLSGASLTVSLLLSLGGLIYGPLRIGFPWPEFGMLISLIFFWIGRSLPRISERTG